MKKNSALVLLLLLTLLLSGAAKNFPWYGGSEGYYAAVEEQKTSKDPILLYFYTTWCPYCRNFEKKVLNTPAVEKALAGTRRVKIDVDFEKEIAAKYGVESFPRVMVVSAAGKIKEIHTDDGAKSFLSQVRKAGLKLQ